LAAVALNACAPHVSPATAAATLHIGAASEPRSLNPLLNISIDQNNLLRLLFDPLVASDAAGNPTPALAARVPTQANGGISADGLTITYHLRHDVRWQDGVALTSRDIAFSTRAMLDPKNPIVSRRGYDAIASVATPDRYTVRVRLKHRFAPFVATYFSESDFPFYPVPEHLLARERDIERAPYSAAPVGDGPFRFVRWERGDHVELAANDDYYGGKPKLRSIIWRFVPDENTELAQLRTGELDMAITLSPLAAAQLAGDHAIHIVASPVNGYFGLLFNTRRVSDVRVRHAIATAIDAASVRATITHGFDRPAVADLPAFLWAFDSRLHALPYDPVGARALMQSAGYGPQHPFPLDLAIIAGSRTNAAWAVLLQATLARIGVDVRIHPYTAGVYGAGEGSILRSGRYDATIYFWIAGIDPDDSSQFLCDQRPQAGQNVALYCSAEMDAAQRAALEHYDRPTRKAAYARIESLLLRDVPIVFVGSPTDITALRGSLAGFAPNPVTPSAQAQNWRLSP
jgi:peptide/nickel transport system substrate-binding protein